MNEIAYESNSNATHRRSRLSRIRSVAASLVVALTGLCAAQAEKASIDVLIVYTPAVTAAYTNHDGVLAEAQLIVAKGTLGFENSLIDAEFNLVHAEEIAYTESISSYEDDLNAITETDGVVDNVLTLRDDWGADIVCLLRSGSIGGTAGLGWVLKDETGRDTTGFSVASVQSAVSGNTFAHEVGHNLGATHDAFAANADPDGGLYLYSHGHHFDGTSTDSHRTIMAYQKSFNTQVNFFSNPDVSHLGAPTGIAEGNANPADNARTLTTTTPVVAGYRTHQTEIPSFPTPFPNFAFVEGQSKTIVSQAVGTPPLTYQWYEGVSGDTSSPINGATGSIYSTPVLNDTTVYWIRATNPNGSGDSPSITLTTTATPAEANTFDQNHDPNDFNDFFQRFSFSNGEVWQEFVPSKSYLHALELKLWKNDNPGRLSLKFSDENGVVLHSLIYEEGDLPSISQWLNIPLRMYVNAGSTYRVTLQRLDDKKFDTIMVNATDQLADLSSNIVGTNVPGFVADNDTVTIGDDEKFQEISFWVLTGASESGIVPTFEYSTGVGTWAAFTPTDQTNGFTISGSRNVTWNNANIPSWAVGAGSEFLIRITRTADAITTSPILFQIRDRRFFAWQATDWDDDGDSYPAGASSRDGDGEFEDYYFRTTGSSASPPTADIDPIEKTIAGGPGSYDITVTSSGDWSALEALDWVSISPNSDNGDGTVTVTVEANNTGSDRSGFILIGGNNHTITQSANTAPTAFDEWLLTYYTSEEIAALSPSAGEADSDDDGLNNNGEFLLLLDPSSHHSRPKIVVTDSPDGIVITISPYVEGVVYRLNSSTDFTTWNPEPTLTPTVVGDTVTFTIPAGSEKFFQLEIEAAAP